MPLFTGTQEQYYDNSWTTEANGVLTAFTLPFDPLPASILEFTVYFDGVEQNTTLYDATPYNAATGVVTFDSAPADGVQIMFAQVNENENLGNYQFIPLRDIINNFIISYVGEEKIISKVKRADVSFHAQRAIQELSYDTFKSTKTQEIDVPPSLTMKLPHDYVNYVKVAYSDLNGVEKILYPARKTSNPKAVLQSDDYSYLFDSNGDILEARDSDMWTRYQSSSAVSNDDSDKTDVQDFDAAEGKRYGLEPENAQVNGIFYIDDYRGKIHFSSGLNGKTIILKYISDGLGTEDEMIVHKFAEEAVYKWIAYGILSTRINVQEYLVQRFKREKFAETRKAKLRLSNLKSEELAQVMRGKSKTIKH